MFIELKFMLQNIIRKREQDQTCGILLEQQIVVSKILLYDYVRQSWAPRFSLDFRNIAAQKSRTLSEHSSRWRKEEREGDTDK